VTSPTVEDVTCHGSTRLTSSAPRIVTDIPASRRIVGEARALTPVGDARAMARSFVEWAHRDRNALHRDARARFDDALTFDAIGRDLSQTYERLGACAS
jgi:glycosyltransferase involved in cell wall biosynthesis